MQGGGQNTTPPPTPATAPGFAFGAGIDAQILGTRPGMQRSAAKRSRIWALLNAALNKVWAC
jgi:hypothetical protein